MLRPQDRLLVRIEYAQRSIAEPVPVEDQPRSCRIKINNVISPCATSIRIDSWRSKRDPKLVGKIAEPPGR